MRRIRLFKRLTRRISGSPDVSGVVFNVQKFSIHDGPGIRTTVFLKGCPLRCLWCSNPESMHPGPEIITRFLQLCSHCGQCVETCEKNAIRVWRKPGQNPLRILDRDLCDACMRCVENCPTGALSVTGRTMTVSEIMRQVVQDAPFYKNSGGGLTVSGGEPLFQPDFTLALLKAAKKRGIHTALDTSGHAAPGVFEKIFPYCDLVLFDVKHPDGHAHIQGTGVDNRLILDNLAKISGKARVWLRVPLIPGFNESDHIIYKIMSLAQKHCVEKLFFLPFHRWGEGKYAGLGRKYPMAHAKSLPAERLRAVKRIARINGLTNVEIESC